MWQSHSPDFRKKHTELICQTGWSGSDLHVAFCDIAWLSIRTYKHQEGVHIFLSYEITQPGIAVPLQGCYFKACSSSHHFFATFSSTQSFATLQLLELKFRSKLLPVIEAYLKSTEIHIFFLELDRGVGVIWCQPLLKQHRCTWLWNSLNLCFKGGMPYSAKCFTSCCQYQLTFGHTLQFSKPAICIYSADATKSWFLNSSDICIHVAESLSISIGEMV